MGPAVVAERSLREHSAQHNGSVFQWMISVLLSLFFALRYVMCQVWAYACGIFCSAAPEVAPSDQPRIPVVPSRLRRSQRVNASPQFTDSASGRSSLQLCRVDNDTRRKVTAATQQAMLSACGRRNGEGAGDSLTDLASLSRDVQNLLRDVVFYPDNSSLHVHNTPDYAAFLSHGAVLSVPMFMDYDAQWNKREGVNPFIAVHGVAINLRPRTKGGGRVEADVVNQYFEDMTHIIHQLVCVHDHALSCWKPHQKRHAVWFPFGMGAFLREVLVLNERQRQEIGERLAQILGGAWGKSVQEGTTLHICLSTGDSKEARLNRDAIEGACAQLSPDVSAHICIEWNMDAAALAQDLANRDNMAVALVIAGNPGPLGNRWTNPYTAKSAMEENVYRRSTSVATIGRLLNESRSLSEGVSRVGGSIITTFRT